MPRKLAALSPKHHAAIRQKVAGASGTEIAKALGVKRRTVYLWMGDPMVKDELARQLKQVEAELTARLATAALVSIDRLQEIMQQPLTSDPTVMDKVAVANSILDRYEGLRTDQLASESLLCAVREWQAASS